MMDRQMIRALTTLLAILALGGAQSAMSTELITNGNFETPFVLDWTRANWFGSHPDGDWRDDTPGTTAPLTGLPTSSEGGQPHGNQYVVMTACCGIYGGQQPPLSGTHTLRQAFTTLSGEGPVILRFDLFANDSFDTGIINPGGLRFTLNPNQHFRVDILTANADLLEIEEGVNVLGTPLVGVPLFGVNPFVTYEFDITDIVGDGGTYQLRFAAVHNRTTGHMTVGLDNVSVQQGLRQIPEPPTYALLFLGLVVIALTVGRNRSQCRYQR